MLRFKKKVSINFQSVKLSKHFLRKSKRNSDTNQLPMEYSKMIKDSSDQDCLDSYKRHPSRYLHQVLFPFEGWYKNIFIPKK